MLMMTRAEFELNTKDWVRGLDAIPTRVLENLLERDMDELTQLYCPEEDDLTMPPMWGCMYTFETSSDESYFVTNEDILKSLYDKGVIFYESKSFDGVIFGIDSCGYDFYSSIWESMYKHFIECVWDEELTLTE